MDDLCLVVPSRGRPENIERLVQALDATCDDRPRLMVGLDFDDPLREVYPRYPFEVEYWNASRRSVVAWLNTLAFPATERFRFIGTIGDDNVPRTSGWDKRVIETLEEVPMCFGDDLFPRPKGSLPCHIFMRSEVIRTLGYMGPPAFTSMYVDNVWSAWGHAIGIRFLADVIMEHMHPYAGKAEIDDTYVQSWAQMGPGKRVFDEYMGGDYKRDLAKLRALMAA